MFDPLYGNLQAIWTTYFSKSQLQTLFKGQAEITVLLLQYVYE